MADFIPWVIIVGVAPSGLLLALLLGKQGIPVQVVEKGTRLDTRPRATYYAQPAVYELNRAGVAAEARRRRFTPDGVVWSKLDGTYLAGFNSNVFPADDTEAMISLRATGQTRRIIAGAH